MSISPRTRVAESIGSHQWINPTLCLNILKINHSSIVQIFHKVVISQGHSSKFVKKVNFLSLRTNRRYRLYFQFSVLKLSLIELLMTKKRSLTCFRCRKVKFTSSVRKEGDIVFVSSSNLKRTACFFW